MLVIKSNWRLVGCYTHQKYSLHVVAGAHVPQAIGPVECQWGRVALASY